MGFARCGRDAAHLPTDIPNCHRELHMAIASRPPCAGGKGARERADEARDRLMERLNPDCSRSAYRGAAMKLVQLDKAMDWPMGTPTARRLAAGGLAEPRNRIGKTWIASDRSGMVVFAPIGCRYPSVCRSGRAIRPDADKACT